MTQQEYAALLAQVQALASQVQALQALLATMPVQASGGMNTNSSGGGGGPEEPL